MTEKKDMVKALWALQGSTELPGIGSHVLTLSPWLSSLRTLKVRLMQGSPADCPGPHPGLTLGKLLNFLELSCPLCQMGEGSVPTPVPAPGAAVQGESLGPDSPGSTSGATSACCASLKKLLNFSELPFLPL